MCTRAVVHATGPLSPTATTTGSATGSPTSTASGTATNTRSATATGVCPTFTPISGPSGSLQVTLPASGSDGAFTGASCPGYQLDGFRKAVLRLDLQAPTGGHLTLSTCGSAVATALYAGYGCGTGAGTYQCQAGAGGYSCGPGNPGSVLTVCSVTSSTLYIMVGRADGAATATPVQLQWSYSHPDLLMTGGDPLAVDLYATNYNSSTRVWRNLAALPADNGDFHALPAPVTYSPCSNGAPGSPAYTLITGAAGFNAYSNSPTFSE